MKYAIIAAIVLFLVYALYSETSSVACYKYSEKDAIEYVDNVYGDASRVKDIFGYTLDDVYFFQYEIKDLGRKGEGFNSVQLTYASKKTNKPVIKVAIFEDCDLHWMKIELPSKPR